MTNSKTKHRGFTIIEVVLVLAIAGLIFLMVFIALPALQRSQRNTRRRQDMTRFASAITDYQSANGRVPNYQRSGTTVYGSSEMVALVNKYVIGQANAASFINGKVTTTNCYESFCDPDGSPYQVESRSIFKNSSSLGSPKTALENHLIGGENGNHVIYYYMNAVCGGTYGMMEGSGNNDVTIAYILEGGALFCSDNGGSPKEQI